jgi:hypothetical protein
LGEYIPCGVKERVMFSNVEADLLFAELIDYANDTSSLVEVSKDKYKITLQFQVKIEASTFPVEIIAKILKVDDDKVCIELKKTDGELMAFYNQYDAIEEYMSDFLI